MLSKDVFVWAGYDITQTRYIEDCIGARVVSIYRYLAEICRRKGRRHDGKNHYFFHKFGKTYENQRKRMRITQIELNEWELVKFN